MAYDPDLDEIVNGDEVVGMDEIVGIEEMIGAAVRQALSSKLAAARRANPRAVAVVDKGYSKNRRKILPVPATSIGAGAEVTISVEPQELFRPERLVVQSTNAADFAINSITVRTTSQLAAEGSVPGDLFAPNAFDVNFVFDDAGPGSKIQIKVQNTTAGALTFRAAFVGTSLS